MKTCNLLFCCVQHHHNRDISIDVIQNSLLTALHNFLKNMNVFGFIFTATVIT